MKRRLLLPCSLAILTTAGCSMAPYQHSPADNANPSNNPAKEHPLAVKPSPSPTELIKESLYEQHQEWKGIPYRLGGMSKRGIDCSALVYLIYRDHMGIELPRTTQYQALAGESIKRAQLRPGDLVFFKTGRRGRHVGIYLEDGKFLHASVSKGVTISHLTDHYWKSRYWRARRLELERNSTP
ncbi:NlpC/P60 family protein [Microbulbifer agarilyticus]|uniref:NlpC/P60 family protein n=1 Tax=Microbulbifer agarilyticus TaxID=260552 RepID=UPI001CD5735C|nr:NlpC/P60 family protein [Microbulbifer agarilyticus]MCA0894831.1 NlpC/P60 family protein [Microbulbifer agarilyticus]